VDSNKFVTIFAMASCIACLMKGLTIICDESQIQVPFLTGMSTISEIRTMFAAEVSFACWSCLDLGNTNSRLRLAKKLYDMMTFICRGCSLLEKFI
jgi:hypothetical protein